jgi:hypothetical protein
MPRILLYSPDVVGHPRIYCRVIADALDGLDFPLVIAIGFTAEVDLESCPDLQPLAKRPNVEILETRRFSDRANPHLTAEELVRLQEAVDADVTLFIEADKSNAEFLRIAAGEAPRLRGRTIGIFAKTTEWYPGEDSFSGERLRIVAPTIRTTLGNLKRRVLGRRSTAKYFYEGRIIGKHVLDEIVVKDERLSAWRGPPVYWMPEISRPKPSVESATDVEYYAVRENALRDFRNANSGRELALYFGDAAFYKGYDLFLQFVAENPSVCAVHAGQTYDKTQSVHFEYDVERLRAGLRTEGRLLETNEYVHSQRLKRLYFGALRLYVTTHRLALSSSTMIQAAEFGIPVLVPDRGLLAHRVRAHGLGGTYQYHDLADLSAKSAELWASDLVRFTAPIQRFWSKFSDEAIAEFFVERLTGTARSRDLVGN